ncbi:MerR family DNA-binding protein [Variovorax sp. PAMC26660]|uniref:MerR family DNA-binding protein n=1 Tax=Variovorax sp. PAMC26660 TaxID=2762322 RepID=UPI00164E00EF|nr:MerR family DNA-binding protein [Variovorax sp. PAMC26660]QNK67188.1 MerR family DNA-binding protein [Variovorax sp. PAMC26660]
MDKETSNLSIGAFAGAASVGVETIRFYQRRGLLPEPERLAGRIRRYGESDLRRVRFIRHAQRLGFSLDEILSLLRLDEEKDCDQARALAEQKLADVRTKMAELRDLESLLERLVQACGASRSRQSCALMAALKGCPCTEGAVDFGDQGNAGA